MRIGQELVLHAVLVALVSLVVTSCLPPPAPPVKKPPPVHPAFVPGPHEAQPKVVNLGGAVLATPKIAPVYFADDTLAVGVDAYVRELNNGGYWQAVTAEYGVGPLAVAPSLHLATAAPASTDDATLLNQFADAFSTGAPGFTTPDPSTMYMFVIPAGTALEAGGACCSGFDGFHETAAVGAVTVAVAFVCECPGFDAPLDDADQLPVVISHELAEAATDPFDFPAFAQTDNAHAAWTIFTGGEVADMCTFIDDFAIHLPGIDRAVQRSWSNAAAAADKDPCVPAPVDEVYFNSIPVLDDNVRALAGDGSSIFTKGKKIAVGETAVIDVQLVSAAETSGPWDVVAYDTNELSGGPPNLTLSFDKSSGKNGDTLKLSVTVNAIDQTTDAEIFEIDSTLNGHSTISLGLIGQQ